jgi:hypothetical protein
MVAENKIKISGRKLKQQDEKRGKKLVKMSLACSGSFGKR